MKRIASFLLCLTVALTVQAQYSGSGSGTENDPYLIYNEIQLSQMSNFLNEDGVVFSLKKDLDLTDFISENSPTEGWQPIGVDGSPFKGKLLGNSHTISGLWINRGSSTDVGFFGNMVGATIMDLTIKGTTITGGQSTGTLGGYVKSSTIYNVTVELDAVNSGENGGGIIGWATSSTIRNVSVELDAVNSGDDGGGMIGKAQSSSIQNFNVTVNQVSSNGTNIGGLVGIAQSSTISGGTISVSSQVKGIKNVGGIVGSNDASSLSNVTMSGNVNNSSYYTGGAVGNAAGSFSLNAVSLSGDISGWTCVGGVIGEIASGAHVTLTSCKSNGKIKNTSSYTGGLIGRSGGTCLAGISNCSHFGDITGVMYVGGIVGDVYDDHEATTRPTIHEYKVYASTSDQSGTTVPAGSLLYTYYDIIVESEKVYNIDNNTSIGNIEGTSYVGGLIGSYEILSAALSYTSENQKKALSQPTNYQRTYGYFFIDGKYYGRYYWNNADFPYVKYTRTSLRHTLTNSYYSGNISGLNYVGGVAGLFCGGEMSKCYAYGTVQGSSEVGGIAGSLTKQYVNEGNYGYKYSTLQSNVANITTISATSGNVGRIYGYADEGTVIGTNGTATGNRALTTCKLTNSGVTETVTDNPQNGTSTGVSLLRLKATYVALGWDFDNKWGIFDTESYPYKTFQAAPPVIRDIVSGATTISGQSLDAGQVYLIYRDKDPIATECVGNDWTFTVEPLHSGEQVLVYAEVTGKSPSYLSAATVGFPGSGTEADPWRIYSAYDLQGAAKPGYYKLMNDIDLTSWINENSSSKGWVPIGYNGGNGIYMDGDNHKVTGLWTNTTDNNVGLFSSYSAGEIKNLQVEVATGRTVKGGNNTGILIGRMADGTIRNCTVKGNVSGSDYTGGVAGYATNTSLIRLEANGSVSGSYHVGGVAGYADGSSASIERCKATSTISATASSGSVYAGGLAGYTTIPITNCKADATIKGTSTAPSYIVGGLVGYAKSNVSQSTAYSTVNVAGTNNSVGGLIGNKVYGTLSQSFASGSVTATGTPSYAGGLVGYAESSTVSDCYATVDVTGTEYNAGLAGYALNTKVTKCYAKGNVSGVHYGAGLVAYLDGSSALLANTIAANNTISLTASDSWGSRVLGGFKNSAPEPGENNYALSTMQVSLNGVTQKKSDDPVEGYARPAADLMSAETYQDLGWNFSTWGIEEGNAYPYLLWERIVYPTGIALASPDTLTVPGQTVSLAPTFTPDSTTNKNVTWVSSNPAVASVSNAGVVTAVATGTTTITATSAADTYLSASCTIIVKLPVLASEVTLNQTALTLTSEGATASLEATVLPADAANKSVTWTSGNPAVATVSDAGVVTAVANGTTTVTATAADGSNKTAVCEVTVDIPVLVTGVTFNQTAVTLNAAGERFSLVATVSPADASNKGLIWTSSNPAVATVSAEGEVRAVSNGTSVITATTSDGTSITATCNVTVDITNVIPGDVNADGDVDVADIVAVINCVLDATTEGEGDVNNDGEVDVADIVAVINFVLDYTGTRAYEEPLFADTRRLESLPANGFLSATSNPNGITVAMDGGEEYSAFQFVLTLPEHAALTDLVADETRLASHKLMFSELGDGRYLVLGYDNGNHTINGANGTLLHLVINNTNGKVATISDVHFSTPEAQSYRLQGLVIDLATGIESLYGGKSEGDIYDVLGRRVMTAKDYEMRGHTLPAGVYIRNGKKMIVK